MYIGSRGDPAGSEACITTGLPWMRRCPRRIEALEALNGECDFVPSVISYQALPEASCGVTLSFAGVPLDADALLRLGDPGK